MYTPPPGPPPPPPPFRPHRPPRQGVPAFAVILIGLGCLMAGCIGGAVIVSAPAPESTTAGTSTSAPPSVSPSASSPTPTPTPSVSVSPTASSTGQSEDDDGSRTRTARPRHTTAKPTPKRTTRAPSLDRRYSSCAAANRAGHGPYIRGVDPEYEWYQDRDGDGRVCERG